LIAWRKASLNNLKRNFLTPLILGTLAVVLLVVLGIRHWIALLYFFSAVFVIATVYFEFSRGTQARMAMIRESAPAAFFNLVQRNKRRYGGFIIHTGMAVLMVGIAASSYYSLEKDAMVRPNQSFTAGGYELFYRDLIYERDAHKEVVRAKIEVMKNGKPSGFLVPERHFYKNSEQPTTEVALRSFWNEDLYLILAGWDEKNEATFKVYVNPLIGWLWWGGFIMLFGGLIVLSPDPKRQPAVSIAPEKFSAQEAQ
jgi:cytochrome c-type biogenesis protein CcmF